jgi:uncharacterized protein YlxP (DUF503 family)
MRVGLLTLSYQLFGLRSIKERRAIVKRLVARVHAEGPAFGVCEIDPDGGLHRASIRVAHLSSDPAHTASALTHLRGKIERGDGYEITDAETEML